MPEIPSSADGDPSAGEMRSEILSTSAGARYKMMSPPGLPITRSPCLTIPPGFSPSALLESPVLLTNMKAEPSPTTGTFAMPLIMNNVGSAALGSSRDSSKSYVHEDGSSDYFEFRPNIRSSSRPGLSTFSPLVSLGSNSKKQELLRRNQSQFETQGWPSSQIVKTENVTQSSHEFAQVVTSPGFPVGDLALKDNVLAEDACNELQLTKDADGVLTSLSDHNSNPLNTVEKSTEDGYNWRKYGQKHVKGSEFPRSYYKCTHPNCQMKKQLERSHDGQITEIIYKGHHDHPKPQSSRRVAVGAIFNSQGEEREDGFSEEKLSNEHGHDSQHLNPNCNSEVSPLSVSDDELEVGGGQSCIAGDEVADDDDLESKRRKLDAATIEANLIAKNNREPRVVVQTVSEVDILDDGYRWRKYGQKVVKGNPNPRSYYKCTNPGCSVRKHVERASHDPKAVITTYEGKHNHDVPAAKGGSNHETSTPLISDGVSAPCNHLPVTHGNMPRTYSSHQYSQLEESNTVSLHLGVGLSSNKSSTLNENHHLPGLQRVPNHPQQHFVGSGQANPMSKLYRSSNNAVFGSREDKGEGFSFSTQINNSSSHYSSGNLVMGP